MLHFESKTCEVNIASVAEQSFVRSLKPTMSPKKMVTQSKFSAETWIFVGRKEYSFLYSRTFFNLISLTMVSGRKSWKAFSVFIFSWSSSWTFSITSFANTWRRKIQFWWIFEILLLKHKLYARWGNEPVSRWEHSWQKSRREEWSDWNMRMSNVKYQAEYFNVMQSGYNRSTTYIVNNHMQEAT